MKHAPSEGGNVLRIRSCDIVVARICTNPLNRIEMPLTRLDALDELLDAFGLALSDLELSFGKMERKKVLELGPLLLLIRREKFRIACF